jgi:hypothetical protein
MKRLAFVFAFMLLVALPGHAAPVLRVNYAGGTASLFWTQVSGATSYLIQRTTAYPSWVTQNSVTGLTFTQTGLASGAYAYMVTARNGSGNPISSSNVAVIYTGTFTDDPLQPNVTLIKAAHLTELRTAVNSVQTALGFGATSWTPVITAGTSPISAADITNLRNALDTALTTRIGAAATPWLDPSLTVIKMVHISQLRARIRAFPAGQTIASTITNPVFSPNADGQKDTSSLSGTLPSSADPRWVVNVRNAGGTAIRSTSGTGVGAFFTWDGRNDSGVMQPEGTYTLELVDANGIAAPISSGTTILDVTPPVAAINTPPNGATLSNMSTGGSDSFTILGTATDAHFGTWVLQRTGNSQSTAQVATGSAPATNQTLGSWAGTAAIPNGSYSLQLIVTDAGGNTTTATNNVSVGNFSVSLSANQANVSAGERITYTSVIPYPMHELLRIDGPNLTYRILVNAQRAAGTYTDVWNADDNYGQPMQDGLFTYAAFANDGTVEITFSPSTQPIGGTVIQYPYPQCRNDAGQVVGCDTVTYDPYANRPLRIVYCNTGVSASSPCTIGGPMNVAIKWTTATETDDTCFAGCIVNEPQSSGQHEFVWYGVPNTTSPPRLVVIRRNDTWMKNAALLYGTAPAITNLVFSPMFNPAGPTPLTFTMSVSTYQNRSFMISLSGRNLTSGGATVVNLYSSQLAPGSRSISWNGHSDDGAWVAPGIWEFTIKVTDQYGSSTTLKPFVTVTY